MVIVTTSPRGRTVARCSPVHRSPLSHAPSRRARCVPIAELPPVYLADGSVMASQQALEPLILVSDTGGPIIISANGRPHVGVDTTRPVLHSPIYAPQLGSQEGLSMPIFPLSRVVQHRPKQLHGLSARLHKPTALPRLTHQSYVSPRRTTSGLAVETRTWVDMEVDQGPVEPPRPLLAHQRYVSPRRTNALFPIETRQWVETEVVQVPVEPPHQCATVFSAAPRKKMVQVPYPVDTVHEFDLVEEIWVDHLVERDSMAPVFVEQMVVADTRRRPHNVLKVCL